jgi:glycosyltransferase involved in cell wall biosynthesis
MHPLQPVAERVREAGHPNVNPSISVVIPAFRATSHIANAVNSVLAQTFEDFEIIIVNDGCPDTANLERVLAPYLEQEQIRYIRQDNTGVSGARNTGLKAARAPFVAMCDSDDRLRPGTLELWMDITRKRPDIAMAYGDGQFFGGTRLDGQNLMKYFPSSGGEVSWAHLITRQANTTAGVMFSRERVLEVGVYDESLRKAEDFDLALRLARCGAAIESTRTIVYDYCVRPESLSHSGDDIRKWRIRVLEKQQEETGLSNADRELLAAELRYQYAVLALDESKSALLRGEYSLARAKLREANRVLRFPRLTFVSILLRIMPWPLRRLAVAREQRPQPSAQG